MLLGVGNDAAAMGLLDLPRPLGRLWAGGRSTLRQIDATLLHPPQLTPLQTDAR
jgi:hypothetical protein